MIIFILSTYNTLVPRKLLRNVTHTFSRIDDFNIHKYYRQEIVNKILNQAFYLFIESINFFHK
jgi:hypothetical protein